MKSTLITFTIIVLICFTFTSTSASDIAALSIKNKIQLHIVEQVLDHAVTRSGDRFIVSLDVQQSELLERSGIEFDVLLRDVDPVDLSLIYMIDSRLDNLFDVTKLKDVVDLGAGIYIGSVSATMATSLSEQAGFKFVPMMEKQVRFYYIPEAFSYALAGLEDFPDDSLAGRVSQDSVYAFDTRLEDFHTRYIWTDSIDAARDWMVQKFLDWGYTDVTTPSFYWGGGWHYNVMAVKPGYAEPDKVIVIGGHYDSIVYGQPQPADEYAPGADDDASGTSVTLELARILADIPLRKTVIFIPFSAEEVGLVGSRAAAANFVADEAELEVMYNFDMVGFTNDAFWDLNMTSGSNNSYVQVSMAAASRVTALFPVEVGLSGSSDHWSFHEQGYNICYSIESDFNSLGWHTNLDLSSRMNFPYLTDVVRMTAAAIGIVANAAYPTEIENVVDMGDGQSLEVFWSNCNLDYTYQLMYGTSTGVYTDTVEVPSGSCSYVVNGLSEGIRYYMSVVGTVAEGYPAIYAVESSGRPLVVPMPPSNLNASPGLNSIVLNWAENLEADFAFYRVYRDDGTGYVLHEDNVIGATFTDNFVTGQTTYSYKTTAVDFDLHESNYSNVTSSTPATFDGGILIADEIAIGSPMPDQAGQELYFDSLFNGVPYALVDINATNSFQKQIAGQYSTVYWFDDDLNNKLIAASSNTIDWYAGYANNFMVSGFRTLSYWQTSPIPLDHVLYQQFGLSGFAEFDPFDFAGATGENGFPTVTVDLSNPLGNLPYISTLTPRPGAQVIYRFDSAADNPVVEGEPCGILYETANGKRIVLAFPLYFLTHESAQQLIAHVNNLFGEGSYVPGDMDSNGEVDIADVVLLVNYMFGGGPPPIQINSADVNGSCELDISDLVYMVTFMFDTGPDPLPGCIN